MQGMGEWDGVGFTLDDQEVSSAEAEISKKGKPGQDHLRESQLGALR